MFILLHVKREYIKGIVLLGENIVYIKGEF